MKQINNVFVLRKASLIFTGVVFVTRILHDDDDDDDDESDSQSLIMFTSIVEVEPGAWFTTFLSPRPHFSTKLPISAAPEPAPSNQTTKCSLVQFLSGNQLC